MELSEKKKVPELSYLRIGTDYYKIVDQPLASGDVNESIQKWNRSFIKDDHGDIFQKIQRYDSFCLIPGHVNYQRKVKNSYNLYEPIPHESKKGNWAKIEMHLQHIFREQYDIGLDYLTILWKYPTQILPILCLVSTERNTGKTTFLLLLKDIFGKNMTFNNNEDFRTHFNSGWSSKLLIGVDEVFLDKPEDTEKLKALATSRTINNEAKGKDRFEQEFFGKFILCANNETGFIKISPEETRFWVRKVPPFQTDNINLRQEMQKEIPAFIHFLSAREIKSKSETRMWFTRDQLWTDALKKVMQSATNPIEKEIKDVLIEQFLHFKQEEIFLTPKDIIELLKNDNGFYCKKTDITSILDKWGLQPETEPKYYKRFRYEMTNDGNNIVIQFGCNGRFYTFKKYNFFEKK